MLKRGELPRFRITVVLVTGLDANGEEVCDQLDIPTRIECPACGTTWPVDAPEFECSCPPNACGWAA